MAEGVKKKKVVVTHLKTQEPHTDFALMHTGTSSDPNVTFVGIGAGTSQQSN